MFTVIRGNSSGRCPPSPRITSNFTLIFLEKILSVQQRQDEIHHNIKLTHYSDFGGECYLLCARGPSEESLSMPFLPDVTRPPRSSSGYTSKNTRHVLLRTESLPNNFQKVIFMFTLSMSQFSRTYFFTSPAALRRNTSRHHSSILLHSHLLVTVYKNTL